KPLAAWGHVLHDPDLAEAILDRVLEHGRHIPLRGSSYRTRQHRSPEDNPEKGSAPSAAPRRRISGTTGAEIPEPTAFVDRRFEAVLPIRDRVRPPLHLAPEEGRNVMAFRP